uniref:Uncharacterized protein n=1 Tax=Oryza barthii TaxID=65489 RepID=A0A0D3H6J3_9ORYZ
MASSSLLRSAGGALRRWIPRRSCPPEDSRLFPSTSYRVWFGRRQSGYEQAFAESPRRRHLGSDCGGSTDDNQKRYSMDELLKCKRQLEKNKEGAFRPADIPDHESKEDELYRKMRSTFDKLCHCLDEQEHILREIEDQVDNDEKFNQVKQYLVAIPSLVCIGLILDRMHMFG